MYDADDKEEMVATTNGKLTSPVLIVARMKLLPGLAQLYSWLIIWIYADTATLD